MQFVYHVLSFQKIPHEEGDLYKCLRLGFRSDYELESKGSYVYTMFAKIQATFPSGQPRIANAMRASSCGHSDLSARMVSVTRRAASMLQPNRERMCGQCILQLGAPAC